MKKTTFICSLGFLFILMACNAGDYEQDPNMGAHSSGTSGISVHGKPARTDLAFIAQQLTTGYSTHFNDSDATLSQKIVLLDSASLYVPLFTSLKPTDFALPNVTDVAVASFNVGTQYQQATHITVHDATGVQRVRQTVNNAKGEIMLNVSYLAPGTYMVNLHAGGNVIAQQKLIKKQPLIIKRC